MLFPLPKMSLHPPLPRNFLTTIQRKSLPFAKNTRQADCQALFILYFICRYDPILQMRKLRCREERRPPQCCRGSRGRICTQLPPSLTASFLHESLLISGSRAGHLQEVAWILAPLALWAVGWVPRAGHTVGARGYLLNEWVCEQPHPKPWALPTAWTTGRP